MRAITRTLLQDVDIPDGPVVELGCGGARFIYDFTRRWPERTFVGVDLDGQALKYSASARRRASLVQANLLDAPLPDHAFALCLALDSFDQRNIVLADALCESRRLLRSDGLLILRVSAYPWLQGPHDAAFGTGRRYTTDEVASILRDSGFEVRRLTHANTLLCAPVLLLRLLQQQGAIPFLPGLYRSHWLNSLWSSALKAEAGILRSANLPCGLSLYAVARPC